MNTQIASRAASAGIWLSAVLVVGLTGCRFAGAGPTTPTPKAEVPLTEIVGAALAADGSGWVLDASHHLFVTVDGGDTWRSLAPPIEPEAVAASGDYMLVASLVVLQADDMPKGYEVAIAVSEDRGSTWTTTNVPVQGQPGALRVALDGAAAAILVQQTTSSNFSLADILVSKDGHDWSSKLAPIAGKVAITAPDEMWIAGGTTGGELFRSADFGSSWEPVLLPVPSDAQYGVDTPRATGPTRREAVVTINGDSSLVLVIASEDSGISWDQIRNVSIAASTGPGVTIPAAFVGGDWRIVTPDGAAIKMLGDVPSSEATRGLLGGVSDLSMAAGGLGWAAVDASSCPTKSDCESQHVLMRTLDGGTTWARLGQEASADPDGTNVPNAT